MVCVVMTPAIVALIQNNLGHMSLDNIDQEPSIKDPQVGNPISHRQLISITRHLRGDGRSKREDNKQTTQTEESELYRLSDLLRGSKLYIAPPKPRPEPTSEYKVLMARLRREEEDRAYERMINPLRVPETFGQRFPASKYPQLYPSRSSISQEDDEITYAEVDRQLALILNILISIIACSVAIWLVSSRWSTPQRLGLSLGGSGIVGVAEVVVYAGYLRRLKDAKDKGRKHVEIKRIVKTWAIGGGSEHSDDRKEVSLQGKENNTSLSRRRPKRKESNGRQEQD